MMKYALLIAMTLISMVISGFSSCAKEVNKIATVNNNTMTKDKIKITVNSQTFTATLLDNKAAKAFKEMLPLTINMIELNGNEKYYDFPNNLPANSFNPQTIKNGDLMLYGSKTLVLFYKTFSTPYSYTKLGMVDNVTGLASALGSGNISVTIESE